MFELLDLKEIGTRLGKIDQHLVSLLAQRQKLTLQVEEWKKAHNQPIIRLEIEDKRLSEIQKWAKTAGINPNFAYSILYFIIRESCSVQIEKWQDKKNQEINYTEKEEWHKKLKENLISLTEKISEEMVNFFSLSIIQRLFFIVGLSHGKLTLLQKLIPLNIV